MLWVWQKVMLPKGQQICSYLVICQYSILGVHDFEPYPVCQSLKIGNTCPVPIRFPNVPFENQLHAQSIFLLDVALYHLQNTRRDGSLDIKQRRMVHHYLVYVGNLECIGREVFSGKAKPPLCMKGK